MLNFQIMTEADRREAALIDRKRAVEEERKKRIFDPRARLFGVDYEALDKQLAERKKREDDEKALDKYYSELSRKHDEVARALDAKEREERRRVELEINEYRQRYQKPEDRREFDLNDPNMYKKLIPVRLHDDDPRCGPASIQKFEGEDFNSELRAKVQREQFRSYLDQQMMEQQAADKDRKAAEAAYKAALMARDQRAVELDMMEKECRRKLEMATCTFNRALADEREFQKQCQIKKDIEDTSAQIVNTLTSDMMTENPDQSLSNLGTNRRIGYMYKGMSPEEKAQIRSVQLNQIAEANARKEFEKRIDQDWQQYNNGVQKSIQLMDAENERKKRELEKQIMEENRVLGIEQRNQKEFLEKVVYTNKPTAAYFDQFNRSTR